MVGDTEANHRDRDFYRYINGQKKDTQGIHPFRGETVMALLNRNWNRQINLMVSLRKSRSQKTSAPFMSDMFVSSASASAIW